MRPDEWERMKEENLWHEVDLRDSRYNQVIHMISAAKGAEAFYQTETHVTRHEGIDLAIKLDSLTSQVSQTISNKRVYSCVTVVKAQNAGPGSFWTTIILYPTPHTQ